jgi:hypothetical protein
MSQCEETQDLRARATNDASITFADKPAANDDEDDVGDCLGANE